MVSLLSFLQSTFNIELELSSKVWVTSHYRSAQNSSPIGLLLIRRKKQAALRDGIVCCSGHTQTSFLTPLPFLTLHQSHSPCVPASEPLCKLNSLPDDHGSLPHLPTAGLRLLSEVSLTPSPNILPLFPIYLYPLALIPSNILRHWLIILFTVSFPHWNGNSTRAGGFV